MMHSVASISIILIAVVSLSSAATPASEYCPTLYSDFKRRQLAHFSPDGAYDIGDGGAKHIPVLNLSRDRKTARIVVGNGDKEGGIWHPMVASDDPETVHFITHIMMKDQNGDVVALKAMDATMDAPAMAVFDVPPGCTELTPYGWCNIHGLWAGETVPIPVMTEGSCQASQYPPSTWTSIHADFVRQQKEHFNSTAFFTEADGVKHTPYITIGNDRNTASILVGTEPDPVHPMLGSNDGVSEVHWITELYVKDNTGKIIAMATLDPTGASRATLEFNVPSSANTLTAYSWCNIHGLWVGPTVAVSDGTSVALAVNGHSTNTARVGDFPSVWTLVFGAAAASLLVMM